MKCGTSSGSAQFAKTKSSSEKEKQYFLKIINWNPSIYKTNYPDLTVLKLMEYPIGLKRVKKLLLHEQLHKGLSCNILLLTFKDLITKFLACSPLYLYILNPISFFYVFNLISYSFTISNTYFKTQI